MNPPKQKGTKFENELLAHLQQVWPDADRAKTNNPSNDFAGIPFPVEAKHRKTWQIPAWCRALVNVSSDGRWALVAAAGDRRKADAQPTVMVLPLDFGMELLEAKYAIRSD
jgi:hypothetical protein